MLQLAKVLKSNGTDGDILIGLFDIAIEEIDTREPVFIEFDGLPVPFFFEKIQAKGNGKAIAHITDIDSLDDAEEIVGRAMSVDYFEEEENDEDFIGWTAYDGKRELGPVTDIEDIPGNPCLDVLMGEDTVMIPFHEDFIKSVDRKRKRLVLNVPVGLLPEKI